MFIIELIYALCFGLAIAWLFGSALGRRGPWNNIFWFFCVIFLFSWGGGVWLTPFGPTGWGVSWLPFLIMAGFITLVLSAATPRVARGLRVSGVKAVIGDDLKEQAADKEGARTAIDIFFWILIVSLSAVIFCHYMWHPRYISISSHTTGVIKKINIDRNYENLRYLSETSTYRPHPYGGNLNVIPSS